MTGSHSYYTVTFGGCQAVANMQEILVDVANLVNRPYDHQILNDFNAANELTSVFEDDPNILDDERDILFTRDNLGRATNITYTNRAWNLQTLSLDQVDNRIELSASLDGTPDFVNTYEYDKLRRLTAVTQQGQAGANWIKPKRVTQSFNALGQRTEIARFESTGTSNPVATSAFAYDSGNRLDNIAHKQGSTNLNTYDLEYDSLSRIETIHSTAENLSTYSYDAQFQVTSADHTGAPDENFDYDASGNRDTGYTVTADNRTTESPGSTYQYDDEGNMTWDGTWRYEWDHRNRLIEAHSQSQGITLTYEYDAFDRLISRHDSSNSAAGTTFWAYDEGINPILQFDNVSGPRQLYLWSDAVDDLLAAEEIPTDPSAGNILWALNDHLGSIRDIADRDDSSGVTTVTNHRRYDAFGQLVSETNAAVDLVFGYTGKFRDDATGLQNNYRRWYDPSLGKWISQDPIGFAGGDANLYRYVANSPTHATDPSGLEQPFSRKFHPKPVRCVACHNWIIMGGGSFSDLAEGYVDSAARFARVKTAGELDARVVQLREYANTVEISVAVGGAGMIAPFAPGAGAYAGRAAYVYGSKYGLAAGGIGVGLADPNPGTIGIDDFGRGVSRLAPQSVANVADNVVMPQRAYQSGARMADSQLLRVRTNTRHTQNITEWRRTVSRNDIGAERTKFLGTDAVKIDAGTWRSLDGTRQFRTVPNDYLGRHGIGQPSVPNTPHVHFEFLAPPNAGGANLRVLKNVHVPLGN